MPAPLDYENPRDRVPGKPPPVLAVLSLGCFVLFGGIVLAQKTMMVQFNSAFPLVSVVFIGLLTGILGTIFDQRKDLAASGIVLHVFLIISALLLALSGA